MSSKALGRLIQTLLILLVLFIAGAVWYYTLGRKPKLTLSTKLLEKDGTPSAHLLPPGEVLLLAGNKATLYVLADGQQKWSVNLGPAPAVAAAKPELPPVAAGPVPAAPPAPAQPDQLLVKRVERRFAKLDAWAAKLNRKRGTLKSKIQIEAFNEEAAKYHAELLAARSEAAPLHAAEAASAARAVATREVEEDASEPDFARSYRGWHDAEKVEVVADGAVVWVLKGRRALALDRANGRTMKEFPLTAGYEQVLRGAGCLYVVATLADGTQQVTRLTPTEAKTVAAGPAGTERFSSGGEGQPDSPNIQAARSAFTAAGSELLQVDIQLVERKITEKQVISGDAVSDMEAADKKTTGGWANDAAVIAETLAKDAARQATGGKERTDESTYEVTLRRPFAAGTAASAPVRVPGRPEVFSTASLDLVVAGQSVHAFDRTNRPLWTSKLAQPLAFSDLDDDSARPDALTATAARPCLEDAERVYIFDKGFLSALDRATGQPRWRLPSLGIRKAQLDGRGTLYVHSANRVPGAHLESIPLTYKINAKDGRIVWKMEKYGDCFASGGSLYATRETRNAEDVVNQVFDRSKAPQTRFKLYKLSTRDGQPQWEWFQTRRPLGIASEGRKVSLLFADELQILKSIAL